MKRPIVWSLCVLYTSCTKLYNASYLVYSRFFVFDHTSVPVFGDFGLGHYKPTSATPSSIYHAIKYFPNRPQSLMVFISAASGHGTHAAKTSFPGQICQCSVFGSNRSNPPGTFCTRPNPNHNKVFRYVKDVGAKGELAIIKLNSVDPNVNRRTV